MAGESDRSPPQYGAAKNRLYRTLLQAPRQPRTWYKIAKSARTSYGWAHPVLQTLQDRALIKEGRVVDPHALILEWAGMPQRAKSNDYHIQAPDDLFEDPELDYAWTTYRGENLMQHHLFPRRLDFYTSPRHWNAWRNRLARTGLIGGGNVRVLLADPHILETSQRVRGRQVVSTPQLIVDLIREGGPCAEAALLLMEKEYGTH